jgi:flagellar hook protein FlgE
MSFDIALSGIQAINEQLTSTSNNIANAGTYGFKSSRANFASMYAGAEPTGVEVGSHTQNIGLNGGVLNTGRGLDASINGRGFFVTRDAQGQMSYTRVGIFSVDKGGSLIDAAGHNVQGYAKLAGSTAQGLMGNLTVPTGQIPAAASTGIDYVGNLPADWPMPSTAPFNPADPSSYNMLKVTALYDSLGTKHTMTQYFVKEATPGSVKAYYSFDNVAMATPASSTLTFNSSGQLSAPAAPVTLSVATPGNGAAALSVNLSYAGTTQFAGEAVTSTNRADGNASGTFLDAQLADDGSLMARYSNGLRKTVGTLALATFANEGALSAVNDTMWTASTESGAALYDAPGTGMAGSLSTSTLEQSNVDITSELVGLMTSQRNYQANSKVLSTENAMLQSLMQAL